MIGMAGGSNPQANLFVGFKPTLPTCATGMDRKMARSYLTFAGFATASAWDTSNIKPRARTSLIESITSVVDAVALGLGSSLDSCIIALNCHRVHKTSR